MEVYHNSRDIAYRTPFGAVAAGTEVMLSLDVADAPGARASLRTWTDAEGESIFEMQAVGQEGETNGLPEGVTRFQTTLTPSADGITWYHFIITQADGSTCRYGAHPGQSGGVGQLAQWEPPSFQLTAYGARLVPPTWYEAIDGFLHDEAAGHELTEVIDTLLENYPLEPFRNDLPWRRDANAADAPLSPPYFTANSDVFGFWRYNEGDEPICILINSSPRIDHDIVVPLPDEEVTELVSGYYPPIVGADEVLGLDPAPTCPERAGQQDGRFARVHLHPFGAAVLHFHAHERLQRHLEPGLGVLAHITSLPTAASDANESGSKKKAKAAHQPNAGTLGIPARAFVDWLAQTGARYWQVLPANPTDEFGSPYAGISAFAGNTRLLADATPATCERIVSEHEDEYRTFRAREADWLEPYASFMAIRGKVGKRAAWQDWPKKYRHYSPELIERDPKLARLAEECRQAQFVFEHEWADLREYANAHGIQIIGDMPIYVSADSADVWANPDLFQLDPDGKPLAIAGCPPDAFAADGQLWGNPLYDWDVLREQGFGWWLRRLERAFSLYDWVRLDHFIGFARYFSIPIGEKATKGTYRPGPGAAFFRQAKEKFGPLPVIAEDLGLLTPSIRALGASCGFQGMDILQFVDGNDPLSGYAPRPEKVVYTGTHDNQTLVGYCEERYPHLDAHVAAATLMETVANSPAPVRIFPLQDLLGLGDEARMNVPGVAEGNWAWRAEGLPAPAALSALVNPTAE